MPGISILRHRELRRSRNIAATGNIMNMSFISTWKTSTIQKRKQNRLKRMESARDFIKQFSRNSIKLLFGKRSTNLLRCCRTIWMNGCGNTMNHVHTAGSIAMGKRRCRHSWIPCHLQKRKCCSIVATFQTKRKYARSLDDVVASTINLPIPTYIGLC